MENLFFATLKMFLWKHWKCYRFSWITNIFLILSPILLSWLLCYAMSVTFHGDQIVYDTIDTVGHHIILQKKKKIPCDCMCV